MRRLNRTWLATGVVALAAVTLVPAAPAYADSTACLTEVPADDATSTDVDETADADNPALQALRLPDVHRLATGRGVGVAVIDSGVRASRSLPSVVQGPSYVGNGELADGHGTIVAGLIAGRGDATGLAPGARIVSVRVSAAEPDTDERQPSSVSSSDVARAIDWAVANRAAHGIRVINLSLGFADDDPAVTRALARAEEAQVVVVAAAGNRPVPVDGTDPSEEAGEPARSPDEVLFPARVDTVLAVTARDPALAMTTTDVLVGPEVDVSAPSAGLRSVMLRGVVCDITDTASSWATAQVSALAALILEREPSLSAAQVRTRIEASAQGGYHDSATDGHGMIQPHAALTAVLDVRRDGTLQGGGARRPEGFLAPEPEAGRDRRAGERRDLLWWGAGAGGLLALALVLRPLTATRLRLRPPE